MINEYSQGQLMMYTQPMPQGQYQGNVETEGLNQQMPNFECSNNGKCTFCF